jgi:hypothetical protein
MLQGSSPPDFEPSRYTDADLHGILLSGNQNFKLVGQAAVELERRRTAREDARAKTAARAAVAAAIAAGASATVAIVQMIIAAMN